MNISSRWSLSSLSNKANDVVMPETKSRQKAAKDDPNSRSIHKLKSKAKKKEVKGVDVRKQRHSKASSPSNSNWTQPLRKHVNVDTETTEYITINVRVLSQVEHDFLARFPASDSLYCSLVLTTIAEREHLSSAESELFSLWIISQDLELQIRSDQDLFALLGVWNMWMSKYTHYPEAEDPTHPINRHWFVYKREASVSIDAERKISGEYSLSMLYGEAMRNYKTARFIVNSGEASLISSYQLQIQRGPYRKEKSPPGFIENDLDILESLIPTNLIDSIKPKDWEDLIMERYKQNQKLSTLECRVAILDFFRTHPCYGGSFFPCCYQLPPNGFFELRTQMWYICIGFNGISVIDTEIHKYIQFIPWNLDFTNGIRNTKVEAGTDVLRIKYYKNDKSKEMLLITPQSRIIENLARKILYIWAKDNKILLPTHKKSKSKDNMSKRMSSKIMLSLQEEVQFPDQQQVAMQRQEQRLQSTDDFGAASNSNSHDRRKKKNRHASVLVSTSGKNLPPDQRVPDHFANSNEYPGASRQQFPPPSFVPDPSIAYNVPMQVPGPVMQGQIPMPIHLIQGQMPVGYYGTPPNAMPGGQYMIVQAGYGGPQQIVMVPQGQQMINSQYFNGSEPEDSRRQRRLSNIY